MMGNPPLPLPGKQLPAGSISKLVLTAGLRQHKGNEIRGDNPPAWDGGPIGRQPNAVSEDCVNSHSFTVPIGRELHLPPKITRFLYLPSAR